MSETNVFFISAETVINMEPNEIRELSQKNRRAAFLSKTLGYACRFRGVPTVKALFESAEAISNYMDRSWMLYILNIDNEGPPGRNFVDIPKTAILQNGKTLEQIPDNERAEVLKYFYENSEKCGFIPSELLFYSFFAHDDFITGELKKRGVKFSSEYVEMLTRNIPIDGCLIDYITLLKNLTNEDFIYVVSNLYGETGQKICCNEQIFSDMKERFSDPNIVELFKTKFSSGKLKVTKRLRSAIDLNDVSELSLGGTVGWLDDPRRRDSLIEYAQKTTKESVPRGFLISKTALPTLPPNREKQRKNSNAS